MHPEIREIIDTSHYCRATVNEAADHLPEDDEELDRWIGEVVTRREQPGFLYLTDLEALREKQTQSVPQEAPSPAADSGDCLLLPGGVDGNQPVRIIEFPKKFHETPAGFPRPVGRGAMTLLGRLAAGEPAAFGGVVRLKDCPATLRVRVGIDHRLLFRPLPDRVQVVDFIRRKGLEHRIKALRTSPA